MNLTRRSIVRLGVRVVSTYTLLPYVVRARAADTCTDTASQFLRSSLHYTAAAPDSAQACSGCAFFSQDVTDKPCGKCQIMGGSVNSKGHCDSWSKKS
jgi:hypothetical protein